MFDLETIRAKISLTMLAEEAGAHFDGPQRLTSRCPLPRHTGDRSSKAFVIYDQGRKWKCHSSCPTDASSGDVFAFYMAWKNVDFKTAVAELAERGGTDTAPTPTAQIQIAPAPTTPDPCWQARAEQFITWAGIQSGEQCRCAGLSRKGAWLILGNLSSIPLGLQPDQSL